ncbi:hypothetical protein Nepgr_006721 [Nepenthes gracilis]|uniref:Uncharacterized protein n=1 Tax=Nepenthes gracilis TaxID=150966 RepID=A0AAD3S634_NEPGR|nr:hypothetical protein Nepgr_006721 [Nepenthes gracilis]
MKVNADNLEMIPASVSPLSSALSLIVDADSLNGKHPKDVDCEPVFGAPDPRCQPGVSVSLVEGLPRGFQLGAMHRGSVGTGIQSEAAYQTPSVNVVASSKGGNALADSPWKQAPLLMS